MITLIISRSRVSWHRAIQLYRAMGPFNVGVIARISSHALAFWAVVQCGVDAFQLSPSAVVPVCGRYSLRSLISNGCGDLERTSAGRNYGHENKHTLLEMSRLLQEDVKEGVNGDADVENYDLSLRAVASEKSEKDVPALASIASAASSGFAATSSRQLPANWLGEKTYILFTAILIGLFTGTNIAVFKTAVEFVREVLYGDGIKLPLINQMLWQSGGKDILTNYIKLSELLPLSTIPVVGGLLVGMLLRFGGEMPPGLRDTVKEGMCFCLSY